MKIKKRRADIAAAFKSIFAIKERVTPTFMALSVDGVLTVEDFKSLSEYIPGKIVLIAGKKVLCVYGPDVRISSYTARRVNIEGNIEKIEIIGVK